MTHPYEALLNGVSDVACGGDSFPPERDWPRLRAEMDVRALRDILAIQSRALHYSRPPHKQTYWRQAVGETKDRLAEAEARLAEAIAAAVEPTPARDGMDGTEL